MRSKGFHFRMGYRVTACKHVGPSEDDIRFAFYKVLFYPLEPFEPYQFQRTRFIIKCCGKTYRASCLFHFGNISQPTYYLYVGLGVAYLGYLVVFCLVYIPERKKIEQIAGIEYVHFRLERLCPARAYTFEIFDRSEENIMLWRIHYPFFVCFWVYIF